MIFAMMLTHLAGQSENPSKPRATPTLMTFLRNWSGSSSVRFTVEELSDRPSDRKLSLEGNLEIEALIKVLEEQVPEFEVLRQPVGDILVLHLVDRRLLKSPDHPLNRKVPGLRLKGHLEDMCAELGKTLPTLQYVEYVRIQDIHSKGESLDSDRSTKVDFQTGDETVREAITRVLPLERYKPVLWCAVTQNRGQRAAPRVEIRFAGPVVLTPEDRKNLKKSEIYNTVTGEIDTNPPEK